MYKSLTALEPLTLKVEEGGLFGFIGPNGAGKTTTIRILATLLEPSGGDARVGGFSIRTRARDVRRILGYLPDDFGVYDDLLVEEYLEFFASAYGIRGPEREKVVKDVLELTDLGGKRGTLVEALSRGMRQRLGLARILVHDPKVLLLDEPASGLDPRARVELREILRELQRMGKTILVSSHILSELSEMCSSVGILEKGRLVYAGPVEEVLRRLRPKTIVRVGLWGPTNGDMGRAAEVLKTLPYIDEVLVEEPGEGREATRLRCVLRNGGGGIAEVARLLVEKGFPLGHLEEEKADLEEAFLEVTEGLVQ